MVNEKYDRMIKAAPRYYRHSAVYKAMQATIATELEQEQSKAEELRDQLNVFKATWGLKYWERQLGITVKEQDSYDLRRARVLTKIRGVGNFSIELVELIAGTFSDYPINATVDIPNYLVIIDFTTKFPNVDELKERLLEIIHAHLGLRFRVRFNYKNEVKPEHNTALDLKMKVYSLPWVTSDLKSRLYKFDGLSLFDGSFYFNGYEILNGKPGPNHVIKNRLDMDISATFSNFDSDAPGLFKGPFFMDGTLSFDGTVTDEMASKDPINHIVKDPFTMSELQITSTIASDPAQVGNFEIYQSGSLVETGVI